MTQDADKLIAEIRAIDTNMGVYPAAIQGQGAECYKQRDGFKNGWNACVMEYGVKVSEAIERADTPWLEAERIFAAAGEYAFLFLANKWGVFLNDTWYYASADWEEVKPEQYDEVVKWYRRFGEAGLLYWVYLQRQHLPQIPHVKRTVEAIIALLKADEEAAEACRVKSAGK